MSGRLNRSNVEVTTPDGIVGPVTVLVNGAGRFRMTRRREVLADRDDVTAVRRVSRKLSVVEFADGSSWPVADVPCGCS